MRRLPATVVGYVVEVVLVLAALLLAGGARHELLYSPPLIAGTLGLVYGLWPAWAFLSFVAASGVVYGIVDGMWSTILVNGTMLALLAAPPTWRHARRGRPRFLAR